jgi:tetratricopeptide (TPR) repeat protein
MVGLQLFQHSDSLALEPFLSAFRMDSNFVLTLVWAKYAAANAGMRATSDSIARIIAQVLAAHGDRLSLYERLALTSESSLADSNYQVSSSAVAAAAALAPGSNFSYMLGQFQTRRMQYAKAALSYGRVDSDSWLGSWAGMVSWAGYNAHMLGQFEQQLAIARKALSDNPAERGSREVEASALAALGRMTEVESSIAAAGPRGAWNVTWYAGVEAYVHGNRQAGLELLRRARRAGLERPQDVPPGFAAITSVYLGDWQEAERLAREPVLLAAREAQVPYLKRVAELGAILAMMGRADEARSLSRRLAIDSALVPHPAGVSSEFERVLGRAFIAAALGEKDSALVLLEQVRATAHYGWDGDPPGYRIYHSPFFEALRSDPRFLRLIGMQ